MLNKNPDRSVCSGGLRPRHGKPELRLEEPWPQSLEEFRALVRKYQHRLVRYAFCRLGNLEDAEDVIQKVFAKAFLERTKKKKISRFGPYLYRMAANACIDHLRRNKRAEVSLDVIPSAELTEDPEGPSSSSVAMEIRRIETLLRGLPEKQAEVIRLCIIEELSLPEVADIFGCSIDTVKSRFRYGIKKLRPRVSRDLEV